MFNRYIYVTAVCVLSLIIASLCGGGILRLHIVAHSDAALDQSIKLAVRDEVLRCGRDKHPSLTASGMRLSVMRDAKELLSRVEDTLRSHGAHYGARMSLGRYGFPEREYMGRTFPEGEYEALRIVLGDGLGQNWWCVMFPPLCILEDENGEIGKEAVFESLILNLIREAGSNHE